MNKIETGEIDSPKKQENGAETININEKFSEKLAEIGLAADPEKLNAVMTAGEIIDIEKMDDENWMVIYDKNKRIGIRKSEVIITASEETPNKKTTFQLDMKPKVEYKYSQSGQKGKKPSLDQYDKSSDAF